MRKAINVLAISLAALLSISLVSCGKKTLTPEENVALKDIIKQWEQVLAAIENQNAEGFMSLCSENVTKNYSKKRIEDYLKESLMQMEGKARTDYEIASGTFNKEGTEVTVTFKSRRKKDFVKENGKWLLKNL